jgi:hypothetical protein
MENTGKRAKMPKPGLVYSPALPFTMVFFVEKALQVVIPENDP